MNKKILGFGLLAALFFMNKDKDTTTTTNNNTGTGNGTGSGGFGNGTSGSLPTGAGGTSTCTGYYMYNNIKVCEDLLPDYGFFWWDGTDGAGWYNINQFVNVDKKAKIKGMTTLEMLTEWALEASNASSPNYTTSMNNLRASYASTSTGPLAAA